MGREYGTYSVNLYGIIGLEKRTEHWLKLEHKTNRELPWGHTAPSCHPERSLKLFEQYPLLPLNIHEGHEHTSEWTSLGVLLLVTTIVPVGPSVVHILWSNTISERLNPEDSCIASCTANKKKGNILIPVLLSFQTIWMQHVLKSLMELSQGPDG